MAGLEKIVTDELVFDIADRLTGEGRRVTNRLVWDHIGGGSMTTIAGALRRWREKQQRKVEPPAARVPLPDSVAEGMRQAVERLWATAQQETQKEIDRLTDDITARVAEAAAERDSALAELQSTVEELQGCQGKAAEEIARLTETLAAVTTERDAARQEAADARENAARLQGQIEAMTAQHAALMKALATRDARPARRKPDADQGEGGRP